MAKRGRPRKAEADKAQRSGITLDAETKRREADLKQLFNEPNRASLYRRLVNDAFRSTRKEIEEMRVTRSLPVKRVEPPTGDASPKKKPVGQL